MKKTAVLTTGGDAPGMNACVRASVGAAPARDAETVGVRRGYAGLFEGDFTVNVNHGEYIFIFKSEHRFPA